MFTSPLLIHVKKGTKLKPGSLVGEHAARADYVTLENGDAIGVVHATNAQCRKILEAEPGITVAPPQHRPLKQEHVDVFQYAGVTIGDTGYDAMEKLFKHHLMPWLHPETTHDANESIQDLI